jgi:hypothetical protein
MKRYLKRLSDLAHRIQNTKYWLGRGMPLGKAWRKADLTF